MAAADGVGAARRWPWLAAYGLATFFSFPVGGSGFDVGFAAAWLGPACLLLGLRGQTAGAAARSAFLASVVAHTAVLHWIYVVTVTYGHAPPAVGVLAPAGLAAYIAAHTALFGALVAWLRAPGAAGPFVAAAAWTAVDHLRSFSLSGFPWATLGYAQHEVPAWLGLASLTGVYGLSFVTVLGGAALARAVADRSVRAAWPAVVAVVAAAALGAGVDARHAEDPAAARVKVAVVQGNIDQGVKWSDTWALRTLQIYEDLTRQAADAGAKWVVWPETAIPGSVTTDAGLRARLAALATQTGASLVVGGVGLEGPSEALRFYDSAFLFPPGGELEARYDKSHLVPFGEYVPLRDLLGHVFSAVARGMANRDVSAGGGPEVMLVQAAGGRVVPVGVPICYELLFPDLVRRFVGEGAEVLLAITNDAWYGRTGAPYQFLAITALRSAENRVWTARAANTGISAFIDSRGRVQDQTAIFERGFLVREVPLLPPEGGTFYTRHGDWFSWACWIAVGATALVALRRRRAGETAR